MPTEGDLRCWWVTNPPAPLEHATVQDVTEAKAWLSNRAKTDLAKGDLVDSNAGGLEIFEDGEWCEWYDHDGEGDDIWALIDLERTTQ